MHQNFSKCPHVFEILLFVARVIVTHSKSLSIERLRRRAGMSVRTQLCTAYQTDYSTHSKSKRIAFWQSVCNKGVNRLFAHSFVPPVRLTIRHTARGRGSPSCRASAKRVQHGIGVSLNTASESIEFIWKTRCKSSRQWGGAPGKLCEHFASLVHLCCSFQTSKRRDVCASSLYLCCSLQTRCWRCLRASVCIRASSSRQEIRDACMHPLLCHFVSLQTGILGLRKMYVSLYQVEKLGCIPSSL